MTSILQTVLAQAPEGQQANPVMAFLPFIAIAVVFYFVFFRPQARQQKKHAAFIGGLKKGDEIVTASGIVARIVAVEDRTVQLDVGGGTKLRVLKGQVAGEWVEKVAEPVRAE